jgi:predicted acylesterase/phospholipase RssA
MTIKHLVLSGGGPVGIMYLGAIEYLHDEGFLKIEEIESIYATSIGTMIAVFISLNYDWETLNKYVIERPWNDVFKISAKQIMDAYSNKGVFDIKPIEKTFKPLLEAKDLSLSITLKEFYEHVKKDLYFYAFDLNSYSTIEISHKNYPNLSLVKAIYMSCTLPGIFIPTFLNDMCIIDGAPLANFPINYCLRDHDKDEILGFNCICTNIDGENSSKNNIITEKSNILDYILSMSVNSINYITSSIKGEVIPHLFEITATQSSTISIDGINNFLNNQEHRKLLFDTGVENAKIFIQKYKTNNDTIDDNKSIDESDTKVIVSTIIEQCSKIEP